jgi:hypothetical protein
MRADVIELSDPLAGELALHSQAPLLNHGRGIVRVHRANVKGLEVIQIDGAGVEEV